MPCSLIPRTGISLSRASTLRHEPLNLIERTEVDGPVRAGHYVQRALVRKELLLLDSIVVGTRQTQPDQAAGCKRAEKQVVLVLGEHFTRIEGQARDAPP